jgi:hypothetical protein
MLRAPPCAGSTLCARARAWFGRVFHAHACAGAAVSNTSACANVPLPPCLAVTQARRARRASQRLGAAAAVAHQWSARAADGTADQCNAGGTIISADGRPRAWRAADDQPADAVADDTQRRPSPVNKLPAKPTGKPLRVCMRTCAAEVPCLFLAGAAESVGFATAAGEPWHRSTARLVRGAGAHARTDDRLADRCGRLLHPLHRVGVKVLSRMAGYGRPAQRCVVSTGEGTGHGFARGGALAAGRGGAYCVPRAGQRRAFGVPAAGGAAPGFRYSRCVRGSAGLSAFPLRAGQRRAFGIPAACGAAPGFRYSRCTFPVPRRNR